jgi:hypothetical protein
LCDRQNRETVCEQLERISRAEVARNNAKTGGNEILPVADRADQTAAAAARIDKQYEAGAAATAQKGRGSVSKLTALSPT